MPMPPDVESYLRSLAHRFNEPDLRKAADEIEALRAELEKKEFLLGETLEQLRFEQAEAAEKDKRIEELEAARRALGGEEKYPCVDCGVLRTKAEGGTTFTVCDECWDKRRALDGEE